LTAYCLVFSWRRWPDLLVDFGRELYVPWRLANGAVLYRDVDDYYGPLSQYLNATLFSAFGPGLMVLVWANLAIFVGIVSLLFLLLRRAWGPLAATIASATFIVLFGFTRFSSTGSFNYATPYAHEASHGMLVLLLLTATLARWCNRPELWTSAFAGLLAGLTLVLKPEIALAGGVITLGAVAIRIGFRSRWDWRWCVAWAAAAATPTLFFVARFWPYFEWQGALAAACRGWLNVVATSAYVRDPVQLNYLGLDAPLKNVVAQLRATGIAFAAAAWIGAAGFAVGKISSRSLRYAIAAVMLAGLLVAGWENTSSEWIYVGRCLPFAGVALVGWQVTRFFWTAQLDDRVISLRIFFALLGLVLMARMALNARIYQFGFYQAAIEAVVLVAFLIGEFPGLIGRTPMARATILAGAIALIGPGLARLVDQNRRTHTLVNFPVGEGRDQFLTLQPSFLASTQTLGGIVEQLSKLPPGQKLLVLPEGLMLNYLARMPSPLPQFFYYSVATEAGKERELVGRLEKKPPEWVVLVARDLKEYGIEHYGERSGAGKDLLEWLGQNYDATGAVDGRPMEVERDGAQVFRRKMAAKP
jgi:hypothetical protein